MAMQSGQAVPSAGNSTGTGGGELPATLYSWIVIVLALLVFAVSFVDRLAWSVAIPVAAPAMKLSMTEAGGLMTAFYLGYVFSNLPGGWLADRFGPRLTLGVSTIITGLFTILFPLTDSYAMGFILRIGAGLGGGAIFACGVKYQLGWFPKKIRATAMGVFMTGPALGTAMASGALPVIVQGSGWQQAFTYAGVATIVIAVGLLLFGKERGVAASRGGKKAPISAGQSAATGAAEDRTLRDVLSDRTFIVGTIACFLTVGAGIAFVTWAVAFFTKVHGLSLVVAGGLVAAYALFGMVGPFVAGGISDLLKRRKPIAIIGCVGEAVGLLLLAVVADSNMLWVLMLFIGVFQRFVATPLNTLQAEAAAASASSGAAMGIYNTVGQVGSLLFPVILGAMLDATKQNYLYVFMAIAACWAGGAILIAMMREGQVKVPAPAPSPTKA